MIDYTKLKQLRSESQVSFSLCKKALEESDNDIEKSMKLLKKWGIEKAEKKADRETKAGGIFSYIHHNTKIASLVELQSETDFVSGNADFKKLGNEIAMQAASVRAEDLSEFLLQDYIREPGKTIDSLVKDA